MNIKKKILEALKEGEKNREELKKMINVRFADFAKAIQSLRLENKIEIEIIYRLKKKEKKRKEVKKDDRIQSKKGK